MQREPCPPRYRIRFPAFLDLAQDRVRSRLIFPLVTLAIYILIAFAIIGALKKDSKPPSELKARLPFPNKYGINTAVNSTFPSPRILVSNSEGIMPNKTIKLKMKDLIASDDPAKPDCDASRRSAIAGSLEYIRYKEVCRVKIMNSSVVSDKDGEALFEGLKFVRMPQGSYYFAFEDEEKYTKSQEFSIFFQSNVIKLEVLTPPPFQQAVGKPFATQPKIRILDQNGKIIKNKRVVAFSWAEPRFSGSVSAYFPENGRYALLGGDLSSPSDDNGIASFTNLTILGSNSKNLYIFFACDGLITQLWGIPDPAFAEIINVNIKFINPIVLETSVGSLFLSEMDKEVEEGELFNKKPTITVKDTNGNPMENKLVIASLYMSEGRILPHKFDRFDSGYRKKKILFPIPGNYSSDFTNPFTEEEYFVPFYTNKSGMITFNDIMFSTWGASGSFQIIFECEGVSTLSPIINVKSKVKSINIIIQPPGYISSSNGKIDNQLGILLQILGANDKPIAGKTPSIKVLKESKIDYPDTEIKITLDTENESFNPSDENGFVRLYFKFGFIKSDTATIVFKIIVDSAFAYSVPLVIEDIVVGFSSMCGSVKITGFNKDIHVGEIANPPPKIKIISVSGDPLQKAYVKLDSRFTTDAPTDLPSGILPNLLMENDYISNQDGEVILNNFKFSRGVYSTFQFFAKVFVVVDGDTTSQIIEDIFKDIKEADESEIDEIMTEIDDLIEYGFVQVCESDPVEILLRPVLSKIAIDYTLTPELFAGLNINLGSSQVFKLNFYDYDGVLIKNRNMPINFQKLQLPYYLTFKKMGLYHEDQLEDELSFSNTDAGVIDKNGDMYIHLKVNEGTPGKYAINFFATGVYSQAVLFQTNFNFKKIELVTSFTSTYDPNVGIPAGIPLNQAFIKVIGTDGYPALNCAVYAQIYNADEKTKGFIDYSEITYDRDPFAVISTHRIAFTQMNGLANFNKLTLVEVTENLCAQFIFYVGDKDKYIVSDPTPKFCFKSDSNFDTKNSLYSKVISMNNPLINPLVVKYSKNKLSDLIKGGIFIVAAVPFEVAGGAVSYPLEMSKLFLRNNVCVYKGLVATKSSAKICTKDLRLKLPSDGPVSLEIQMQGLKWTQSAFSTSLYLSISNLFSYTRPVNPSDTTLNNYTRFIGTKESEKIEVSNTPSILEISAQPPSVVYVGDVFEVRVICKVSSGSPIVKGEVKASLVQFGTQTGNTTYQKIKSLLFNFASGKTDINSIKEYTKKNSNAEMEYNGTIAKTNRKGQASFNLKILSGMPGIYALIFETQALQTRPSSPFTLINRINSLSFINQPSLSYTKSDDLQVLSSQPRINITFRENLIDLRPKQIEVRIYKAPEKEVIEAYKKQLNDSMIETKSNLDSIIVTKISESNTLQDDFMKVISNLANAVVNGGKIVASTERVTESFKVETGNVSQLADGSLKFENLQVQWSVPGTYCLLVVVNGVESELSQEIEVKEEEISIEVYILSILQKLLIIVLSVSAILANSAGISYFWTLAGFAGAGLILGLMDFIDADTLWKIIIYVITALIILVLFEIVWSLICYFRSPRRKKSTMIFHVREEMFYEYTYQMLFHRKSENWKNNSKGEYMNPFVKLAQKLEENTEKKLNENSSFVTKKDIEMVPVGKSPTVSPEMFSPAPFSGAKLKSDESEKELENFNKVYESRAEKVGLVANFKRLFVPFFSPYLKDDWVINDCFFYPQRFLASCLLGVVSVAYFAYQFFDSLQGVFQKIEDMGSNIRSSYMAFMGGALSSFKQSFGEEKFDEQTFKAGQNFVNWVSNNLQTLGRCLSIGFYVGSAISLFAFVILMFFNFYTFKMRILDFRKGVFCVPKEKLNIVGATGFVGTQTAVSMVSFLIMAIIMGIAFTVLVHPLFWELLFENIIAIIVVIGLAILNILIEYFLLKYMIHEIEGVKKRRLYAIYELYTNFSEILGGILSALGRILKQIILSLVSLLRIDESLLPEWIYLKNNMDATNSAFLSAVYMYHTHNHPICVTFANICGVISNNLRKFKEKNGEEFKKNLKKIQFANRMHVYLLLNRHPELQKCRKSKDNKKKDEIEKGKEKNLKEDIVPLRKEE